MMSHNKSIHPLFSLSLPLQNVSISLQDLNKASPTGGTPTADPTYSQWFASVASPTRDSGTQLARGTNWIQSCSLQAKKKNEPSNPEQMEFWVLFSVPRHPISHPSPRCPPTPPLCHEACQDLCGWGHVRWDRLRTPQGEGAGPGDRATPIVMKNSFF